MLWPSRRRPGLIAPFTHQRRPMASINLRNVSVEFPIYQAGARSLKKLLIAGSTRGNLARDAHDRVMVRALHDISLSMKMNDGVLTVVNPLL